MKKLLIFSLICFLSGLMAIACQRGVEAGREGEPETYQPRPAPKGEVIPTDTNQMLKGELIRIDMKNQTMTVRAENGMEQTFKFNDQTTVQGLPMTGTQVKSQFRNLMGQEGSEITVTWKDEAGAKTATTVSVNELAAKNRGKTETRGRY